MLIFSRLVEWGVSMHVRRYETDEVGPAGQIVLEEIFPFSGGTV
jgi:hypothetical protein